MTAESVADDVGDNELAVFPQFKSNQARVLSQRKSKKK